MSAKGPKFNKKTKYKSGIARIPISGTIGKKKSFMSLGGGTSPTAVIDDIDLAEEDDRIKALLFSVDSPGGHAAASFEISDRIKSAEKPSAALISGTGASGSYMIASACDRIVAYPMSTIGSIGVVLPRFDFVDLMGRLGIKYDAIKTGEFKDLGTSYRELDTEGREKIEAYLQKVHSAFVELVAGNRNMEKGEVEKLADGWIMLGQEAKDKGLVDEVGNLDTAIKACEELGKFVYDKIVDRRKGLLDRLSSGTLSQLAYVHGRGIADGLVSQTPHTNNSHQVLL